MRHTRFHQHGILRMLCKHKLYRFAVHTPVLAMLPNASYFPFRLRQTEWRCIDFESPNGLLARLAYQSDALVHIAQDVLILKNKISFGSQQLQFQLMFLSGCCHSLAIYHSCTLVAIRSTPDLNVAWILLLQNVTPNGVNFAKAFDCTSISFFSFLLLFFTNFFWMQLRSNNFNDLYICFSFFCFSFLFSSAPIEVVRHDLFIQTWMLRFNLNGFFLHRPVDMEKQPKKKRSQLKCVLVDRMGCTRCRLPSPSWTT